MEHSRDVGTKMSGSLKTWEVGVAQSEGLKIGLLLAPVWWDSCDRDDSSCNFSILASDANCFRRPGAKDSKFPGVL